MSVKTLDKIRALFVQEAEQRLGRLGQLVLQLEQDNEDHDVPGLIAEIFREVHTLKGSAAVVGFEDVGAYAHSVEDKLLALRSGAVLPTAAIVDALLVAIDRLGAAIWEAVGDQGLDHDANAIALCQLDAAFADVHLLTDRTPIIEAEPAPLSDAMVAEPSVSETIAPVPAVTTQSTQRAATPAQSSRAARSAASREDAATVMVPIERLDELVRMVGEAAAAHLRVGRFLTERTGIDPATLTEFSSLSLVLNGLQERAMRTRMVPVSTVTDVLQRAVRDAARSLGKDVRWEVRGEDTELDRGVLLQLSDSLLHLVRNAVDHGIESPEQRAAAGKPAQATVRLHAMQLGSEVIITVTDDGGGIDLERVRTHARRMGIDADSLTDDDTLQLIFAAGFSTSSFVSDLSGRGVGLDAVRSNVEAARGRVEVRSTPGVGGEFRIIVPITLAVLRCLIVETAGQQFALPLHRVAMAQADSAPLLHAEGQQMLRYGAQAVPMSNLADVLGLEPTTSGTGTYVVVNATVGCHAFHVDGLVGQRDVVIKALSALVPRLDVIGGTSVQPDGSILLLLDPVGLIDRARRNVVRSVDSDATAPTALRRHGRLLVVDDALPVRELQRSILERAGFDVTVACDGIEALAHLDAAPFDLVLTDVEMPRMDGFTLTEQIRSHPSMSNVAVLILTSLASDDDRRRGMDVGADGYIVKSDFDERSLLAAVDRLVGTYAR